MSNRIETREMVEFYRDEVTDRDFYTILSRRVKRQEFKESLVNLANIENEHVDYWGKQLRKVGVDPGKLHVKRVKLIALLFLLRFLGLFLTIRLLEHGELSAIKAYKRALERQGPEGEMSETLRVIIQDEIEHEEYFENLITKSEDIVQRNQDIVYGMSDGFIEVLGAMSGLAGVLVLPLYIAISGFVVALSGSLSMMLGAYLASKSKSDYKILELEKKRLFRLLVQDVERIRKIKTESRRSAYTVGAYYLLSSAVPIAPYLVFPKNVALVLSIALVAVAQAVSNAIIALSVNTKVLRSAARAAFLSMGVAIATYAIGYAFHVVFNISLG